MMPCYRAIGLSICWLIGHPIYAQDVLTVPEDTKFVVQVNVAEFRDTRLGRRLLDLTQKMAAAELGSESSDVMFRVEETLGFNPLEEVQSLTVVGRSFEDAEDDLQVVLRLRQTTGNLEGLMLALPNYESEEVGQHTVHSASDGGKGAYMAVHTGEHGDKTLLAATQRSDVITLLEAFDSPVTALKKQKTISWVVPEGTFLQLQLLQLPAELLRNEQAHNISKLLEDVAITAGERGEDIVARLLLTTSDEKRAEQIQQLVQGLKALVGLFKEEIGDDQEAQMAISIAENVQVERDGTAVVVSAAIPQALIIQLLREEADLPL